MYPITVTGPGILGEGKKNGINLKKPEKAKFVVKGKEEMLDYYRDTNKVVTESVGFVYVDIRSEFLELTKTKSWYTGHITMDGEHPNERGTVVICNFFIAAIRKWLMNRKKITNLTG